MGRLQSFLLTAFISAAASAGFFGMTTQNTFHSVENLQSKYQSLSDADAQQLNRNLAGAGGLLFFTTGLTLGALIHNSRHPS